MKKNFGFTLIELLVVMAIIALFGGAMVSILFSLFRGANKTSTLINLRQVGNYSVDQVTRAVRDARSLDSPDPSSCDGNPIGDASGSSISLTTQDNQQNLQTTTLACTQDGKLIETVGGSPRTLIDGATVKVYSCSFSCTIDGSQTPVINFNLTVMQKDAGAAVENTGMLNYRTSIVMRNTQ